MLKKLVILAGLTPMAAFAQPDAQEFENFVETQKIVLIDDVILASNIGDVVSNLYSFGATKEPAIIVIDSYGGGVDAGGKILQAMDYLKQKGTPIQCLVTGSAMSMAAWIYLKCDERAAVPGSVVMWHGARVFARQMVITQEVAKSLYDGLKSINDVMFEDLKNGLDLKEDVLKQIFLEEKDMPVEELAQAGKDRKFLYLLIPSRNFLRAIEIKRKTASLSKGRSGRNTMFRSSTLDTDRYLN